MRPLLRGSLLVRLLVPILLIPLLGISPKVRLTARALSQMRGAKEQLSTIAWHFASAEKADIFPWRPSLWERAGVVALRAGDPGAAIHYLEISAALEPPDASGLMLLGDAYEQAGDLDEALQSWGRALEQGGPGESLYRRLLRVHQEQGNPQATIEDLQALARLAPSDTQIRYQLAVLLAIYEPESALAHLVQVGDSDPERSVNARRLERSIRQAGLVDNDPAYQRLVVGRTFASQGEWVLASLAFQEAARLRPDYAEAWAFLGESQSHLGVEAYPALRKAHELNPSSLSVNLFTALYWQRHARHDYALTFLKAAASADPQNPALQVELGNTMAGIGEVQMALSYFQHAVALTPKDTRYWKKLASFSIQNELQVQDVGLPAARQAVLLDPEDPSALDLVGQAYHLLGDELLAMRFLSRAIQADPNFTPAYYHIALVYLADGNLRAARSYLNRVLALSPEGSLAENARQVLQYYFP